MAELFPGKSNNSTRMLLEALAQPPKPYAPSTLADLFAAPAPARSVSTLGLLGDAVTPPVARKSVGLLALGVPVERKLPTPPPALNPVRRKVFFSFHYADVIRVNNVRHSEQFKAKALEVPQSFYDRSLWERRQLSNPDALKRLIREGVENSSVICVLAGTNTWSRRWVRYEIARAVIDGKGLLTVNINGLNHHRDRAPHVPGINPLANMAVGRMDDGTYRLFERRASGWYRYHDYAKAVTLPRYLDVPAVGYVTPLSKNIASYDYASQYGSCNIAIWIDRAAAQVGR